MSNNRHSTVNYMVCWKVIHITVVAGQCAEQGKEEVQHVGCSFKLGGHGRLH